MWSGRRDDCGCRCGRYGRSWGRMWLFDVVGGLGDRQLRSGKLTVICKYGVPL